jgi:hypothetical protein
MAFLAGETKFGNRMFAKKLGTMPCILVVIRTGINSRNTSLLLQNSATLIFQWDKYAAPATEATSSSTSSADHQS